MAERSGTTMRIRLEGERRERALDATKRFFEVELDQRLSDFNAERILDFFARELGAPVYNQAIGDARKFMAQKLEDLDVEFYEPDEPWS